LQITFVPYTLSVRPAGAHFLPTNEVVPDDLATVVAVGLLEEPEFPDWLVPPEVPAAQTSNAIFGPIE
jgi:hypothetical protein